MQNWLDTFSGSLQNLVDKLEGWVNLVVVAIPNIILAAIVLGLGIALSRLVNKYISKLIARFSSQQAVNRLLSSIVTTVFILLVLFVVLSILQLDTALQSLLAGAGVAGLAVGLALQDPIVNLFSGVMMSTRHSFRIGDLIETNDFFGTIKSINLRSTIIRTPSGQQVVIPNKAIYQNPLMNYSDSGERRVDIACGVSYGDDLKKSRDVAVQAIEEQMDIVKNSKVEVFFNEFGSSSINFTLRFWIEKTGQADYLAAQSAAIMAVKSAFDQADITIPFPIRTLDFGVEGGVPLAKALPPEMLSSNGN